MEPGESSGSAKPIEEFWAKLVSVDLRYSAIEICSNEMVICSEVMRSSPDKYEWCKITRIDRCSANVRNISLQTISVDDNFLEKEDEAVIKCGAEIISGPDEEGYMTFRFEVMPIPDHCKKQLKISLDMKLAKCEICSNIWNDVITVSPCFHNFCNGCLTEWLRSQEEDESVLCPQCQSVVDYFGKNQFLQRIEEEIMESDPSLKRSREQVECLEENTSNNLDPKKTGRRNSCMKRPYSTQNEENNVKELPCPQCGTKLGGFQCDQTTAHLQCQACRGMMPSRTDTTVPQHYLGCGGSFCWAYWQAQGVVTSETHTICSCDNFKPISERTISRIPLLTHHNNHIEQNITTLCIEQMEKTLQDIISDWIMKLKNREIDRTRMPLNHAERIIAGTHLCNECYEKLVSFLLYWFRITVPNDLLPPDSSTRKNCWYGYECHTQHNNEEHARKLNHVCRPTRGSNA